jgi:hypothetical protein
MMGCFQRYQEKKFFNRQGFYQGTALKYNWFDEE